MQKLEYFLTITMMSWLIQTCPQDSIVIESSLSSYSCKFEYQLINNTCTFKKCNYQSSSKSSSEESSWVQCYEECCEDVFIGDPISMLYQCQGLNAKKRRILIGLAIGLTLSLLALIATLVACCSIETCPIYKWREKRNNQSKYQKEKPEFAPVEDIVEAAHDIAALPLQNTNDSMSEFGAKTDNGMGNLLNFDLTKNIRLMRCKCAVCQQVKPHCYLTCNHYFHINCIGMWLERHKRCPCCGTKELKFVHIYCVDCRAELKVLSVSKFRGKYRDSFHFRCKECEQKEK